MGAYCLTDMAFLWGDESVFRTRYMCGDCTVYLMYYHLIVHFKMADLWEFPDRPVVMTWHFHCQGPGLIPDWRPKIPQAAQDMPPPDPLEKQNKTKQKLVYIM